MKYYTVVLDGIDKTGKDLIAKYIWQLDHRILINVRGWPSLYAYNIKYNRQTFYELPNKAALYIHLLVEKTDWQVRCKITNEPKINYDYESKLFVKAFDVLIQNKYHVKTVNTTYLTPYQAARLILEEVYSLERS